jgi:phage head maturation protease
MHEDVKNGFYEKMSFSFVVLKDEYDKATRTRRILEIDRLYDVSLVDFPAYEQTSISARSFYEAEAEMERHQLAEASERARKLKRLQVLVDLESEVN